VVLAQWGGRPGIEETPMPTPEQNKETVGAIYLVRINEQGQIAEHWGVVDTIGTMGQLGLLPAPDQASA